jgi:hypothetical protein
MKHAYKMLLAAAGLLITASTSWADTLPTHRIPAVPAVEPANETVAACARQGYRETAVFDQVSQQIGQTLFIENRPGAGGTLAADFVAKRADVDCRGDAQALGSHMRGRADTGGCKG